MHLLWSKRIDDYEEPSKYSNVSWQKKTKPKFSMFPKLYLTDETTPVTSWHN